MKKSLTLFLIATSFSFNAYSAPLCNRDTQRCPDRTYRPGEKQHVESVVELIDQAQFLTEDGNSSLVNFKVVSHQPINGENSSSLRLSNGQSCKLTYLTTWLDDKSLPDAMGRETVSRINFIADDKITCEDGTTYIVGVVESSRQKLKQSSDREREISRPESLYTGKLGPTVLVLSREQTDENGDFRSNSLSDI